MKKKPHVVTRRKIIKYISAAASSGLLPLSAYPSKTPLKGEAINESFIQKPFNNIRFTEKFFADSLGNSEFHLSAALEVIGNYREKTIPVIAEFSSDAYFNEILKVIRLSAKPENDHFIKFQFQDSLPEVKIYARLRATLPPDEGETEEPGLEEIFSKKKCINSWHKNYE